MARKDPKITGKIKARKEKWDKYWRINRTQYHEWVGFVMGDQWREDESKLFERYNKIPLTFNKLGALMNHMLGDQMQNTPGLQIYPDDNVPVKTAEVRAAIVKNIALDSDSKTVYQTAYWQAIVGGYGAYRIGTEYRNKRSFEQNIKVYEFTDPTKCYWDIGAKNKCKTDGMASGFSERMSRKMFRGIYGKKLEQQIGNSADTDDTNSISVLDDDDSITLIYDYERVYDTEMIYQLSDENNTIIEAEEYSSLEDVEIDGDKFLIYNGEPVTVLNKRSVPKYKIKHRVIAGEFILEEEDFPSEQLPIIFVDQKSYFDKRGTQICRPFFQDVKDAQRFLNYLATQQAYLLKVSRYDQFMAPRSAVKNPDTQQIWRDPSVQQGALIYDQSPDGAKPEQLKPPELAMSLLQQYERCLMDIQTGSGIYNAQLGEQGNETAGIAIAQRKRSGSYNTYVPKNSLNIAIACGAQIMNEMIPKVYDTQRMMMLAMPDAENQPTEINKPVDAYGMQMENDMSEGEYKIRLLPGESYEGQKAEALESLQMVLAADKSGQTFPMIADLYVENLPLSNHLELRNRLRTMVPPEIIEAGKTGKPLPPKQPQPSPEQEMIEIKKQELQMKAQAAQQEYQQKAQELQLKQAEIQRKGLEMHQDVTMAWEKMEAEKEEAAAKLQESILRYQAEMERLQGDKDIAHANNLVKILTHHPREPKARE